MMHLQAVLLVSARAFDADVLIFGVAYGMLGSVSEAEDVTQEALLRLTRKNGRPIDEPAAWMTTSISAADARRRRC